MNYKTWCSRFCQNWTLIKQYIIFLPYGHRFHKSKWFMKNFWIRINESNFRVPHLLSIFGKIILFIQYDLKIDIKSKPNRIEYKKKKKNWNSNIYMTNIQINSFNKIGIIYNNMFWIQINYSYGLFYLIFKSSSFIWIFNLFFKRIRPIKFLEIN